jgi:hypothetical protein
VIVAISTGLSQKGHKMKKIVYIAGFVALLSTGLFQGARAADSAVHVQKTCATKLAPLVRKINQFTAHRQILIERIKELENMVAVVEEKMEALTANNGYLDENVGRQESFLETTLVDMLVCEETMQPLESKINTLKTRYQEISTRIEAIETEEQSIDNLIEDVETRYTEYQAFFDHVALDQGKFEGLNGPQLLFTGTNVHIRSGWGYTEDVDTGLGNLIIGYNENTSGKRRPGAHNLVIGPEHSYSSYGGFVSGHGNTVSGPYASVSGGTANTAGGLVSSVSAGEDNSAGGLASSISGGRGFTAEDDYSYAP